MPAIVSCGFAFSGGRAAAGSRRPAGSAGQIPMFSTCALTSSILPLRTVGGSRALSSSHPSMNFTSGIRIGVV